ncbi:MAG: hypothetical protein GY787_21515 [Alteromonadales bacterium]|nr:hypothetical protein [Alteromonadales bacterium]
MRDFRKYLNNNVMYRYPSYGGNHKEMKCFFVKLKSGLTMSVQAGDVNYCTPRVNFKHPQFQRYTEFEVGFPSLPVEELHPYIEDERNPTQTVYGWVPYKVIQDIINKNGGIKTFIKREREE